MTTMPQGGAAARNAYFGGIPVQKQTAALAASTVTLFTIATGMVAITSITGRVTTVIGATVDYKLIMVPTTGTTTDITTSVTISTTAVGTTFGFNPATYPPVLVTGGPSLAAPLILPRGNLRHTSTGTGGVILWQVTWVPYEDGATLVAA